MRMRRMLDERTLTLTLTLALSQLLDERWGGLEGDQADISEQIPLCSLEIHILYSTAMIITTVSYILMSCYYY